MFYCYAFLLSCPIVSIINNCLNTSRYALYASYHLKQLFLNIPKLEYYKGLLKSIFTNLVSHAQRIYAVFAFLYICQQLFSIMKLEKKKCQK